jgi:hypothetical protein
MIGSTDSLVNSNEISGYINGEEPDQLSYYQFRGLGSMQRHFETHLKNVKFDMRFRHKTRYSGPNCLYC